MALKPIFFFLNEDFTSTKMEKWEIRAFLFNDIYK